MGIVLSRARISLIENRNISNSFYRIGIEKLAILKHSSGAEWNFSFVPTLFRFVILEVVGTRTWFIGFMAHKVLINKPGFRFTILIVFHIK